MAQCEGTVNTVLEEIDGFPSERKVRCGQSVGLTSIASVDGTLFYACHVHRHQVQSRIDRNDAHLRARKDREEDAQEALRRRNDANEELRMWGGKYAEWGR